MIYFDESGYTGPDLTNSEQPYFTLVSIRMTDQEIIRMKHDIAYDEWDKELHFKSMYKNRFGRGMLHKIFTHPLMDANHVLPTYAYKRYCIYAYIVDILIEPMCYNQGLDLYNGAQQLFLANLLYRYAFCHPNKEMLAEFEKKIVQMIREPSKKSVLGFYRITETLINDTYTTEEFSKLLRLILPTANDIEEMLDDKKFRIDLTIPLFSISIQNWYKKTGVIESVMFDSSEPLFANKEFMESLRDMDVQKTEVGSGIGKHIYPFPIGNIEIEPSHKEFGIQIADVFASALNFALKPRNDRFVKYQEEIKHLSIFQNGEICLAPASIDFIKERMNETAEIAPLDFLCEHL